MSVPSCPMCSSAEQVDEVNELTGRYFCSACPCVFDGGGQEALAVADRQAQRRHPNAHSNEVR